VEITRRTIGRIAFSALASTIVSRPAFAAEQTWRHGLSLFGTLKYPAGFPHFDYVNPQAPKGGLVRQIAFGTFDNFNMVVAGVKGSLAGSVELTSDTLMASALDEVSTEYGLLAESVSHPEDFSSVTYRLRANAKWHDGKPVTPDDVIFSFDAFKKNSPQLGAYYRHVTKAEKTGERDITFTFDQPGNRELPQIVGQLNVLPKHWWEGTDASGKKRAGSKRAKKGATDDRPTRCSRRTAIRRPSTRASSSTVSVDPAHCSCDVAGSPLSLRSDQNSPIPSAPANGASRGTS